MDIVILGSCATRDSVEFAAEGALTLIDYTARTSLASLATAPHKIPLLLDQITSPFQRRMVERDMDKSFWPRLQQQSFDRLVLDFIDDRFPLFLYDQDTQTDPASTTEATMAGNIASAEYQKASKKLKLSHTRSLPPGNPTRMALWEAGFDRLIQQLQDRDMLDRLVINAVYWTPTSQEDADVTAAATANAHLDQLYKYAARRLPESAFIRYPDGLLASDPNHKWGPASFHYVPEVYHWFLQQLQIKTA